jgi:hypothetical protein
MEEKSGRQLIQLLQTEAATRGLIDPTTPIDLALAFTLVRDMPYRRASSRIPETIIQEWQGTCSGKHYLLKALFAELGYASRVIACSTVTKVDPAEVPPELAGILEKSGGRFVDIHNYLILEHPDGEMVVDATWPVRSKEKGFVVNEVFELGTDMTIAADPIERWVVPADREPQDFKDELLRNNFSPEELRWRDQIIQTLSRLMIEG